MNDDIWLARFSVKTSDPDGDQSATRSVIVVLLIGVLVGLCWAVLEATAPRPPVTTYTDLEPIVVRKIVGPVAPTRPSVVETVVSPVIDQKSQMALFEDTLGQVSLCQRHWAVAAGEAMRDLYIARNLPPYEAWSQLSDQSVSVPVHMLLRADTRVPTQETIVGEESLRGLTRDLGEAGSAMPGGFVVTPMECAVLRTALQTGDLDLTHPASAD